MEAAAALEESGVSIRVVNAVRLKPFPEEAALELLQPGRPVFTVEEHNVRGGLGGILAETLAYSGTAGRIVPIGLNDCFAEGYGTQKAVRKANALDAENIARTIRETLTDE